MVPHVLAEALNTKSLVLAQGWGRHEEGEALLRQSLRIALDNDLGASALRASFNLAHAMEARGRSEEALELDRDGLELARRRGDRRWELLFLMHLAERLYQRGDWDESLEYRAQIPRDDPNVPHVALMVVIPEATILAERGDVARARESLEVLARDLHEANLQERAGYELARASVLLAEGNAADALAAAAWAFEARDRLGPGHALVRPGFAYACEAALRLGDVDRVAQLVDEVDAMPRGTRPPFLTAQAARFDARLAALDDDSERADARSRAAVASLRELSYPFWLAVALLERAEWLSAAGRADEAAPLAQEAASVFNRLGARAWLERAAAIDRPSAEPVPTTT